MKTGSAAAPHTYVVEPRVLDRFPVDLARRIAHELLVGAYAGQPYSTEKTKGVADELRDRLKCALRGALLSYHPSHTYDASFAWCFAIISSYTYDAFLSFSYAFPFPSF